MSYEPIIYPEKDIRPDKQGKYNLYFCFRREMTLCVKARCIEDIRKYYDGEPAFHITELVGGLVFNYLGGVTKCNGRELLLIKEQVNMFGTDRIIHTILIVDEKGEMIKRLSSQRRMPRCYLEQLDEWNNWVKENKQ